MTPELRAGAEIDRRLQAGASLVAPRCGEADFAPSRFGKPRQAANLREQLLNGRVVNDQFATVPVNRAREFIDARGQLGIRCQRRAHAHKGPDNQYAGFYGPGRPQQMGSHQTSMFRECQGQPGRIPVALRTSRKLREVGCKPLGLCEPEHEVRREPCRVAADLLIQPLCENAVQPRQICIQHHALAAHDVNRSFDRVNSRQLFHCTESGLPVARTHAA